MSKQLQKLEIGAVYKHYRNRKNYLVLAIGRHTETDEPMVVYVSLYNNPESQVWIRPLQMWIETVKHQGKTVPRFKKA
jgi:hypothetical protein